MSALAQGSGVADAPGRRTLGPAVTLSEATVALGSKTVVRDVKGVKGVANEIGVKPHVRTGEIENAVSSAIKRNAELDARSIWVTTDNGTVHLHGNVHSFHERVSAELAASPAPGVVTVDNQIKVSP